MSCSPPAPASRRGWPASRSAELICRPSTSARSRARGSHTFARRCLGCQWYIGTTAPHDHGGSALPLSKRVVVIGATGHIGSYLIPRLVRRGYETVCVSRRQRQPYVADEGWAQVEHAVINRT